MKHAIRTTVIAVSASLAALPAFSHALGGAGEQGDRQPVELERGGGSGEPAVVAVLGIPIADIIAAASRPADHEVDHRNPYRKPRPSPVRDYFPTPPPPPAVIADDDHYGRFDSNDSSLKPWSREWFAHCANAYPTFDRTTGTYIDERGRRRFCVAR